MPFADTSTRFAATACAVIHRSSLTRMPVEQMVCMIRERRGLLLFCAVSSSRRYSSRVSSLSVSQNIRRCRLNSLTRQPSMPVAAKNLLSAASLVLTVADER